MGAPNAVYAETGITALSKNAIYASSGSSFGNLAPIRVFRDAHDWDRKTPGRVFRTFDNVNIETGITALSKNAVIGSALRTAVFHGGFVLGGSVAGNIGASGALAGGIRLGGTMAATRGRNGSIAGGIRLGGTIGGNVGASGAMQGGFILGGSLIGPLNGANQECLTGSGITGTGGGGGGGTGINKIF